jgi:hypothetical protein
MVSFKIRFDSGNPGAFFFGKDCVLVTPSTGLIKSPGRIMFTEWRYSDNFRERPQAGLSKHHRTRVEKISDM